MIRATEEPEPEVIISEEDLGHVGLIHAEVFTSFTQRPWLKAVDPSSATPRLAGPLVERLHVLRNVAQPHLCVLDPALDSQLAG